MRLYGLTMHPLPSSEGSGMHQGNHAKCAHLYNPSLVINGTKINSEPIIVLCICIFSGKKRGGISAASQDLEDTKEMSETRLVLSGGEGYVDFRIGRLARKHTHTNYLTVCLVSVTACFETFLVQI